MIILVKGPGNHLLMVGKQAEDQLHTITVNLCVEFQQMHFENLSMSGIVLSKLRKLY